jgi:hypothetical protein
MNIFARAGVRAVSTDALSDLGPGMHPRISILGGHFTLIDAGGTKYPWPNVKLPVIIVGSNKHKSKVYFGAGYDPANPEPPTCFSDNGVAPSMQANQKMARTCAECEMNAWGSATSQLTGKPIKACNDKKKLAVLVVGDQAGHAYELQVPPVSLANLAVYANKIGSFTAPETNRKADLSDLVTEISFVPDTTGELQFKEIAWLDMVGPDGLIHPNGSPDGGAAIAARLDEIWETESWQQLVGFNDVPWSGALPAPAPVQQLAGPQPHAQAPATGPYAGPAGVPATPPQRAFPAAAPQRPLGQDDIHAQPPVDESVRQAPAVPSRRGGARTGAGRKPAQEGTNVAPAGPAFAQHPAPAAEVQQEIPSFLRRAPQNGGAPAGIAEPAAHPATGGAFGIAQSTQGTGIDDAVKAAFKMSTKRGA